MPAKSAHKSARSREQGFWVTVHEDGGGYRHVFLRGVRGRETKAQRLANDATLKARAGVHAAIRHMLTSRSSGPASMRARARSRKRQKRMLASL